MRGVEKHHVAMRRHTSHPIFARVEHETRPTRRRVAAFASPPHPRARAERRHRVVVSGIIAFVVARRPDGFGATSGGTDVRRREPPTLAVASLVVEQGETHELVDVVVAARAESPRVRAQSFAIDVPRATLKLQKLTQRHERAHDGGFRERLRRASTTFPFRLVRVVELEYVVRRERPRAFLVVVDPARTRAAERRAQRGVRKLDGVRVSQALAEPRALRHRAREPQQREPFARLRVDVETRRRAPVGVGDRVARRGVSRLESHQTFGILDGERSYHRRLARVVRHARHHARPPPVRRRQALTNVAQRRSSVLADVDGHGFDRRVIARRRVEAVVTPTAVDARVRRERLAPALTLRVLTQKHVSRVAVRARDDEDASALVRHAEGEQIDDAIRPAIAEFFEFGDDVIDRRRPRTRIAQPRRVLSLALVPTTPPVPTQKPDDVLQEHPLHASLAKQAKDVSHETRVAAVFQTRSRRVFERAIVAREPGGEQIDAVEIARHDGGDVIHERAVGVAPSKQLATVRVALDAQHHVVSGALEPEIETADAGEERRDAQTHRGDAASAAV
mmetsp:Transcript_6301/g.25167  ORF Transcript_6301/g.25167 Transcript_6301/m.25167 type:complete len:564 (-) Transcript_6301:1868-3559(-)